MPYLHELTKLQCSSECWTISSNSRKSTNNLTDFEFARNDQDFECAKNDQDLQQDHQDLQHSNSNTETLALL